MQRTPAVVTGLILLAMVGRAGAQAPQPNLPTTVQLPTFRFFSVNTTVSVPDKGAAYLAGISRASDGSAARGVGPLRSRATGSARSASMMSVHATIIDHGELDRAVLAEARRHREASAADPSLAIAKFLSSHIARQAQPSPESQTEGAGSRPIGSLADVRGQVALQAQQRDAEAAAWLAKAENLEVEGKANVAKIYYQMVARRASGHLKATAIARIARIDSAGSSSPAATSELTKK